MHSCATVVTVEREEDLCIDSEVLSKEAHSHYGALSQRGEDPIKLAYNQCQPDDWLKLIITGTMENTNFPDKKIPQNFPNF